MNKKPLAFLIITVLSLIQFVYSQSKEECDGCLKYENHNNVDPKRLELISVSGIGQDHDAVPIPNACVGIFKDKKVLKTTLTNENGEFSFDTLEMGEYELIVRYSPFCSANIPIRIIRTNDMNIERRGIIAHMETPSIDGCSYGTYR